MRATRAVHFPFLRTIEEFDFSHQSTLRLTTIGSLLSPDFVTSGQSVILEGKPGRGKTHLAISIAYRALQLGFDALFVNCAELIEQLSTAGSKGVLRTALAPYLKPHVLVIDEVGYLAYGPDAANVLFHVVNERHIRKRSMIFTTNKLPKAWGAVLHDDDLADAIVDRILDRGRLLRLDGPSMRTRHLAQDQVVPDDASSHDRSRFSGIDAAEFPEPTRARVYTAAYSVMNFSALASTVASTPIPSRGVRDRRVTSTIRPARQQLWPGARPDRALSVSARHVRGKR